MSVLPSFFSSDLDEIWYTGRCRWVMHDRNFFPTFKDNVMGLQMLCNMALCQIDSLWLCQRSEWRFPYYESFGFFLGCNRAGIFDFVLQVPVHDPKHFLYYIHFQVSPMIYSETCLVACSEAWVDSMGVAEARADGKEKIQFTRWSKILFLIHSLTKLPPWVFLVQLL